jgi:cytochrome c1
VPGADAEVGPPLTGFGRRGYIAGELPNNPENLQRWIRSPQSVEPGTVMPDLGVTESDARDIAAFLLGQR